MTVRNHTEFLWHDVFAFNCLNPIEAPAFQDWKLERTYMSCAREAALPGADETGERAHADRGFLSPGANRAGQRVDLRAQVRRHEPRSHRRLVDRHALRAGRSLHGRDGGAGGVSIRQP